MSREGRLYLDREGRFFFDGKPVENTRVAELFHRSLEITSDGEILLRVGSDEATVEVEETAYTVRRVRDLADGGILLSLNDQSEEKLDPRTLFMGPGDDLYCLVKREGYPARLLRSAYHHVALRLREAPSGAGYVMVFPTGPIPIRTIPRRPGPTRSEGQGDQ